VEQLFLSLAQLAVAIVLAALAAYLAFYLFQWFTRGLDEGEELRGGNAAVGIVLGAIVVSVAIVLRPALRVDSATWDIGRSGIFFRVLLAQALQVAVGLVLAVVAQALGFYLFAALTRGMDEVAELKQGNLALAGLLAGVLLGVGLLTSQAIAQVLALIPPLLF